MVDSWMCVQHHLFWGHAGGQILVLLHCVKLGLDGRCDRCGKEKMAKKVAKKKVYFQNIQFWLFDFSRLLRQKQVHIFRFRFFTFLFHQNFNIWTPLWWQRVLCVLSNTTTAVVLFAICNLFVPQGSTG